MVSTKVVKYSKCHIYVNVKVHALSLKCTDQYTYVHVHKHTPHAYRLATYTYIILMAYTIPLLGKHELSSLASSEGSLLHKWQQQKL